MRDIKLFISSVIAQTFDKEAKQMATIAIVGTHKDEVSEPAQHEAMSLLLQERLRTTEAWTRGFVLRHDRAIGVRGLTSLNFFPVDNTLGRADRVVTQFLDACEQSLLQTPYVTQKVPLTWLKFIDELGAKDRSSVMLAEAISTAAVCGIASKEETLELLGFCRKVWTT
jgi:hypothetical protein